MPEIRREKLPERVLAHLLARMRERSISYEQLTLLAQWLDIGEGLAGIPSEQKGTKGTKKEFFFVAFVCFCANSVPRASRMEISESVKSVVPFLWLRLPALPFSTAKQNEQNRTLS